MKLTAAQYAQALFEALQQSSPKDQDLVLERFVKILAGNGDLGKYEQIENEYRRLDLQKQGIKEAEVTFARKMESNGKMLEELNRIVGNRLNLKSKTDPGIIGGVIVKVDDTLIDASVKSQINHLTQSLKS